MLRWVFTILSVLSLLLCIAVAVLWVRSYFVGDYFARWVGCEMEGDWTFWTQDNLHIGRGGIGFIRVVDSAPGDFRPTLEKHVRSGSYTPFHRTGQIPEYPNFRSGVGDETTLGFNFGQLAHGHAGERPQLYVFQFIVPLWSIFILFATLPCLWLWRWNAARRRMRPGYCLTCGYDLHAHHPGDLCPECGTAIPISSNSSKPEVSPS